MKFQKGLLVFASVLIVYLCTSYLIDYLKESSKDEEEYLVAIEVNTHSVYYDFMKKYPKSKYYQEVRQMDDEICWKMVEATPSLKMYQWYLFVHSQGKYVEQAKVMVEKFTKPKRDDWEVYIKYGLGYYSISYPQDWMLTEKPNSQVDIFVKASKILNGESNANFNVIVSKNENPLETCFQLAQEQCREYIREYELVKKEHILIEGLDCIKTVAKANMEGVDIISVGYQLKKDDDILYTITFTAHEDSYRNYEKTFNQIIQSFKLL